MEPEDVARAIRVAQQNAWHEGWMVGHDMGWCAATGETPNHKDGYKNPYAWTGDDA